MISNDGVRSFDDARGVPHEQARQERWINAVAVFCGSRPGNIEGLGEEAEQMGYLLAKSGYRVVYGGGDAGNMGLVAMGAIRAWIEEGLTTEQIVEQQLVVGITTDALDGAQGTSPEGVHLKVYEPPEEFASLPDHVRINLILNLRELEIIENADACIRLLGGFGTGLETFQTAVRNDLANLGSEVALKPCIHVDFKGKSSHLRQHIEKEIHDTGLSTEDRRYLNQFRLENGAVISRARHAVQRLDELNLQGPVLSSKIEEKHAEAQRKHAFGVEGGSKPEDSGAVG